MFYQCRKVWFIGARTTHHTDLELLLMLVYFLGWSLPNPSCCVQWQPREDAPFTEQQCQCQRNQKCMHSQSLLPFSHN